MKVEFGKHVAIQYTLTGYEAPENPEEDIELENLEETTPDKPFEFIYGVGYALPALEQQIAGMEVGGKFDITLSPAEAFGEYDPKAVIEVPIAKADILRSGFPKEAMKVGLTLPLRNADGTADDYPIVRMTDKEVFCEADNNHPYAGLTLHYVGQIVGIREITEEDKLAYMKQMTGHFESGCGGGCGGNCGGCGGCGGHEGGCEGGGCGGHEGGHHGSNKH